LRKNIGAKGARKMLVKLFTLGEMNHNGLCGFPGHF